MMTATNTTQPDERTLGTVARSGVLGQDIQGMTDVPVQST